ncbi:hypothetical protein ACFO5K_11785 [Nocardia halotolerans]|uniref:Uncharacterized protein n=1 Tax=Nocardia halotolerans TaxID=1755878 RepID=A0ABV8VJ90_9NOCA
MARFVIRIIALSVPDVTRSAKKADRVLRRWSVPSVVAASRRASLDVTAGSVRAALLHE